MISAILTVKFKLGLGSTAPKSKQQDSPEVTAALQLGLLVCKGWVALLEVPPALAVLGASGENLALGITWSGGAPRR